MGAAQGPDDLDEAERARIRRRVLAVVPPRPGMGDRAYGVLALLAAPAPHLVRAIVSFALVAGVVASATVASADALPDEPLYAMKIASEQLRLALAVSPEDRAAVELSMAQHRLAEAERLARSGSADVVVVTTAYGAHLANAAAALAGSEPDDGRARAVVEQLRLRLAEQQRRAAGAEARLALDPEGAPARAFRVVASIAPQPSPGTSIAAAIAEHAAAVADQLAQQAERLAGSLEDAAAGPAGPVSAPAGGSGREKAAASPRGAEGSERRDAPGPGGAVTGDKTTAEPEKEESDPAGQKPRQDPAKARQDAEKARDAAEKAKAEAEKARQAAEKAKQAAKEAAGDGDDRGQGRGRDSGKDDGKGSDKDVLKKEIPQPPRGARSR